MASVTRSSRRAEGLHPRHHANAHHGLLHRGRAAVSSTNSNKRALEGLDGPDRDFDALKTKRTRISVEIFAKGTTRDAVSQPGTTTTTTTKALPPVAAPPPRPLTVAMTSGPSSNGSNNEMINSDSNPSRATKPDTTTITKHQAKVINGIKHELDRLQPQPQDTSTRDQGRKLRSQEATRFKSELSAYFPEYDEVIGNEPKEQHTLNGETAIVVVDSDPRRAAPVAQQRLHGPQYPVRGYSDTLFTDVYDTQRIDFSFLEAQFKNKAMEDPLPDKVFQPVHRRAERLERSIRNTEKGRAQHEKDQIIRLLQGLQGHDWLRVMGVSGITESKKKAFEPAREHFIKGCQAILSKFRNWILEERRRKLEKEKALAESAEEEAAEEEATEENKAPATPAEEADNDNEGAAHDESSDSASPAKQLREEAMARSKASSKGSKRPRTTPQQRPPPPARVPKPPKPPEPPKEFNSFFSKRYERDGAMNRHRRAGRKVLAWGHPIPEIPQVDFDLPQEYRDEDTLKTRARRKRRDKRGSRP